MGSLDQSARIVLEGCEIDIGQCELVRGSDRQHLTTKEVEVLQYLAARPGRAISHEELLENVWGHSRLASTQPVYSVVKRLRRKLDAHGEHRHLVTVHGVGYRFEPAREATPMVTPLESASLIGRSVERAAVEAHFARGARIVSLVGPGGAGKTCLARALAREWTDRGLDVVSVDVSATRGSDLRGALALAIGARNSVEDDADGSDPIERTLRSRKTWSLVLDDAEHGLDALAAIVPSLSSIVRVLVTSRERLAVEGESVVEIGMLSIADGERLFRERARAAGTSIETGAAVAEVVARLEGLPLAIELAAAHASVVSFESMRRDLDRQIDHLVATRRGVPARHTTLRRSVEWSWSSLESVEREVLSQCGIFSGGFTIAAAQAVVSIADGALRHHLVRLTERSLVRVLGGRMSLYEIVRELSAEHLGDRDGVEARHTAWAVALVRESGALEEAPSASAYAVLAPEIENLLAAFGRARISDPAAAVDLALAIDLVTTRARSRDGRDVLREALAAATGVGAVRLRLALGRSLQQAGADGTAFLEETVALAHASGSPRQALEAERLLLASTTAIGEPGASLPRLEALLDRARALGEVDGLVGRVALDLAEAHLASGSVDRAADLGTEAARVLEASGDPIQAARASGVLSHVHRERSEHEDALASLERARRLLEEAGDEVGLARLELDRGVWLAHLGRSSDAAEALEAAIAAHRRLGLVSGEIRARDWMVLAQLGLGQDEAALDQAREIQQLAIDLGRRVYQAERAFGATWLVVGKIDEADVAFTRALEILAARGTQAVRGHVLSARALARILAGRFAEAEADLETCVRIHDERGSEAARLHARAELALAREIASPREGTEALLDAADRAGGSPWELRHAIGRRAVAKMLRAQRAGRSHAEIERIRRDARATLLEGAVRPTDYFTRCSLLLVDHVARAT